MMYFKYIILFLVYILSIDIDKIGSNYQYIYMYK